MEVFVNMMIALACILLACASMSYVIDADMVSIPLAMPLGVMIYFALFIPAIIYRYRPAQVKQEVNHG